MSTLPRGRVVSRGTVAVAAVLTLAALVSTSTASAAALSAVAVGTRTVVTPSGLSLTATPVRQLDPNGARVTVTGKGYNPTVGIYVAFCVTPPKGQLPSPCGGGVNLSGASAASVWISSNARLGANLAVPYRKGGRFSVTMAVSAMVGDVDCRVVSCSIVTRADHTRPGERVYDVFVPVTFRP